MRQISYAVSEKLTALYLLIWYLGIYRVFYIEYIFGFFATDCTHRTPEEKLSSQNSG